MISEPVCLSQIENNIRDNKVSIYVWEQSTCNIGLHVCSPELTSMVKCRSHKELFQKDGVLSLKWLETWVYNTLYARWEGWFFIITWIYSTTVLCKSNANDNRRISRFVLTIYHRYISETSHGLPNVKTINQQDIGTIFAISRWDIVLARLRCSNISQSKMIYRHDISLQRSSL